VADSHSLAACRTSQNSLNMTERLVISRNDQLIKIVKLVIKSYTEICIFVCSLDSHMC
jgi:hypothetical protein